MHREIAEILQGALGESASIPSFDPLLDGIRKALELVDVQADRIQLPLSRDGGFRHPTYGLVLLTWSREDGFAGTELMTHAQLNELTVHGVVGTPFENVILKGDSFFRVRLSESDGGFDLLRRMQENGYVDYCNVGVKMPLGMPQPMSVASTAPFPDDVGDRLADIAPILALAVYGVYRTSQAIRIASAYIGRESGPRVLAGEIQRGSVQRERAGILFCDLRGYTALSEQFGAERIVEIVNDVFSIIGEEAKQRGGEILKFIGDAMLIRFADADDEALAGALVETARVSVERVRELADELQLPIAVGFGGHIGEVVIGNIGTPDRLDFTVMGPAVNRTSRLEGLCRPLGVSAVFSEAVSTWIDGLEEGGPQTLKGIDEPEDVWVLR